MTETPQPPQTPECAKLKTHRDEIILIRRFLDFLGGRKIILADRDDEGEFGPTLRPIDQQVHDFFGIDLQTVDRERRALLRYQRQLVEKPTKS